MNKSKFLKRPLAALLAILMVVALVPMNALAEETEAFGFPDTITVNNRNAVYDAANDRYDVTVSDTTLASISWTPVADRKVEITTYRGITETVPYDNLDLLTEAEEKEDNVYELTLTVTDTKTNTKYPTKLRITVDVTVPNDDASLQAVRVNQKFTAGGDDYEFEAVKGEIIDNKEIQITLPLGMTAEEVGFDEDNFGKTSGDAGDSSIVSRVFSPSSAFATVKYAAGADILTGKVTVTAVTGRTKEYTVHYVQEAGLNSVAVNFGTNHTDEVVLSERSFDPQGKVATYSAYVKDIEKLFKKIDDTGATYKAHVTFSHEKNVVRVEDSGDTWTAAYDDDSDEPIQSDENTIDFAEDNGVYVAYLNVKTKANYDDDAATPAYFKNVKLELRSVNDDPAPEDPKLVEFQLNGYESVYNEGGLGDTITYYVDSAYYAANVGAGNLASRISVRTSGEADVSIPAQSGNTDFWKSEVTTTAAKRISKPNPSAPYIANVDAGAKSFIIRVATPGSNDQGRLYTIKLQPVSAGPRSIKTVSLVAKNKITINGVTYNPGDTYKEATRNGDVFEFALPDGDIIDVPAISAGAEKIEGVESNTALVIDKKFEAGGTNYVERFTFRKDFFDNILTTWGGNGHGVLTDGTTFRFMHDGTDVKLQYSADSTTWKDIRTGKYEAATGSLSFTGVGTVTVFWQETDKWDDTNTGTAQNGMSADAFKTIFGSDAFVLTNGNGKVLTYKTAVLNDVEGYSKLSDVITDNFYLVTKTGDGSNSSSNSRTGAVITPGGTWNATKTTTSEVGTSAWRPQDSGTTDGAYAEDGDCYDELENGVTTLGELWDEDYLLRKASVGTGYNVVSDTPRSSDMLVLTVTNRNTSGHANTYPYGVTFKKASQTSVNPPKSEEAELTVKRATSALDNDLVYGGRTISSFNSLNNVSPKNDAPYIGAIGGHNEYKVDEPKKVPGGPDNAYYIAVHVPEDFGNELDKTSGAEDRNIYLDQVVLSAGATVTVNSTKYTPDTVNIWPEKNIVRELSLVMDDQTKVGNTGKKFTISDDEQAEAWFNGAPRIAAVEDGNILYVNSEKDEAAGKTGMNSTRVYYIITVKDNWAKDNNLSGITSDDATISGGRYQKVMNVNVPYSYNWSNYRDSSRYDFKLKFGMAETSILVDAAQDTLHGPFTSADQLSEEYLHKDKQKMRNIKLTNDTIFFVKDNELWVVDELTGDEVQITGCGNGVKYSDKTWGTIVTGEAELHVYNESQSMIDIYRLRLKIQDAQKANEIVSIRVDETPAVKTADESVWSVDLSNATGVDLSKVALNITVAPTATIESVAGAPYEANVKKYDLNKDIKIVVVAENGDKKEYTLTAGNGGSDNPGPGPDEKPSDKYDLSDVYSGHLEDVKKAIDMGLMSGTGAAGKFNPKGKIARQDFALIIARA
ncbi:hypothetical protein, partial [Acutalibacter sp. 1XD8-36]|uniref:hypothetical protein n=1 Tax=Acutalibacter sp. 1XD8-36 TaxID=2320852 RepID=UPI001411C65A